MKVILKSNRKTVEFVDGITQINANDVNWQFFKIKLEVPLALRESLWVTFKNQANDEEFTHPFLASLASTGEYYAQIPADVIRNAGVWEFQLFIRQYSTTGTGKYVQYASNKYSFTVEQGLPVSALNAPVDNATISALFRTSNEIIKRFYGVKNVMTAYAKVHAYQGVKIKNVTGCALIDWGDGTIEDGNGKTNTIYSHTYTTAGNYAVRLFNVTNIGESAFEEFSAIYDLELNNSLLSIGKNAFKSSLIDKLCIPMSVEYLADCFTETDLIRAVELKQYDPSAFNHNAFKHFLLNLPFECKVVVPTYAVDAYKNAYITEERPMMFAANGNSSRSMTFVGQYEHNELLYNVYEVDGTYEANLVVRSGPGDNDIQLPSYIRMDDTENWAKLVSIQDNAFLNDVNLYSIAENQYAPIQSIGGSAFKGCENLTRVTFESFVSIDYNAFRDCAQLKSFLIPETCNLIGTNILNGCNSLEELDLDYSSIELVGSHKTIEYLFGGIDNVPASLRTVYFRGGMMPPYMFAECINLNRIYVENVTTIPHHAFYGCTGVYGSVDAINIREIESEAYAYSGYTDASLGDANVGVNAFINSKLKRLSIYGACNIGDYAFQTSSLKNVNIYIKTPPTLGANVFNSSVEGFTITVPQGTGSTYKAASGWSDYADYIVELIPRLDTPTLTISDEGLATWYSANATGYRYQISGRNTVDVSASVTSVYLENGESISVMAIGDGVNYKDSGYSSAQTYTAVNMLAYELVNETHYKVVGIGTITGATITIPNTYRGKAVKAIGANAFENNTTITSVIIPISVIEIAENAFLNCGGLTAIDLPENIVYVGAQSFSGTSISTLDLPSSIQTIASNAFNTETLKTVNVVSYSPCYIDGNVFGENVETISVPYGTGELYKNAWTAYADVIQEVEQAINYELSSDGTYYIVTGTDDNISATLNIPDTYEGLPVKEIKSAAFDNTQFEKIYLPSTLTTIGANAFYGCPITTITIPANVSSIGSAAFANCVNLKTVEVQAVMPPAIGVSIFANDILLEQIIIPEQSLIAYNADNDWKAYSQFFPNYNQGGGDSGGNGDSGDSGGNEGGGNDDEDDGGGGVVKPLQTLSIPIVTITSDGLAMWYAENATAYEFVVDGSIPLMTTATQMQLMDGQSVKVRAIGDGIKYSNGSYSEYYLYNAVVYDGADKPILPEYSDVDITRNVFDRYAFISELEEVNNQKEFDEVHERIDNVEKDVENRVEKTKQANKLYGTDKDGNQTTYPIDSVGTKVLVNGVKVTEFNANTKQDTVEFDGNYDKNANKAATVQTVNNAISSHNVSQDTHKDIRNLISELSNRLNALADSDDTTLDQLSEVVAYIKANKALIESVTTSKVNVSDIINDLETNVANKPLSASQGVALKALINALEQSVSGLAENAVSDISSAVAEETNELTIELKDKNGKVIATTKVTLPTQEIPEVDLTDYVKNTDRNQFVKDGVVGNNISLTDDEKASACDWLGAMPIVVPPIAYWTYVLTMWRDESGKIEYILKDFNTLADKEYVDNLVGDINIALDELHAYAQSLVGGGVEE